MSLDVRYLTNGDKTLYCIINCGVTPFEKTTHERLEDIPESIRHYAETVASKEPHYVSPDMARFLGWDDIFYPDYKNWKCNLDDYQWEPCVPESCVIDWKTCKYRERGI